MKRKYGDYLMVVNVIEEAPYPANFDFGMCIWLGSTVIFEKRFQIGDKLSKNYQFEKLFQDAMKSAQTYEVMAS